MTADTNANDGHAQLSPVLVESTCKQAIDVYHGGIPYLGRLVRPITDTAPFFFSHPTLARIISLDADSFSLSARGRRDYLIPQLAKVVQQSSQLLLNDLDDEYPLTSSSLTKLDGKSAAARCDKADGERIGSTATPGSPKRTFLLCLIGVLIYLFAEKSGCVEPASTHRPMSFYPCQLRRGWKDSGKPPTHSQGTRYMIYL